MKLTPKQKIFVDEYLVNLNATRIYKVAYLSFKKEQQLDIHKKLNKKKKREGVQTTIAEPYKENSLRVDGPAIVITVIDQAILL